MTRRRRLWSAAVMVGASLVSAFVSAADAVCYQYRVVSGAYGATIDTGWRDSWEAVGAELVSQCSASSNNQKACANNSNQYLPAWTCEFDIASHDEASITVHGTCTGHAPYTGEGSMAERTSVFSVSNRVNPDGCPPDPCEYTLGLNDLGGTVRNGSGSTEGTFCADTMQGSETVMSCRVKVAGVVTRSGDNWAAQVQWLGESCGGGDAGAGGDTAPNCASTPSGMFCASKARPNCGTVNGQAVCLDKVPAGSCEFLADGGMVCAEGAATPPAPTDGAGDPATPDGSMSLVDDAGDSYEFNYYSSTTVNGSSTGASGAQPGTSAGGGALSGGDSGEGDSEAEGADPGAICDADGCYGDVPSDWSACVADLGGCAGDIVGAAWSSMTTGIPLLGFVTGLYTSFDESGSCPSANITLFEEEYDLMGGVCTVADGASALLALVFQIGWSFFGLRILLKAQ